MLSALGCCRDQGVSLGLAAPSQWDLVSDKQMQEEQPLQVSERAALQQGCAMCSLRACAGEGFYTRHVMPLSACQPAMALKRVSHC